jgi:hypothetical protein
MFCELHCNLTPFKHLNAIEAWRLAGILAMEPGESFTIADLIAAGGRSIGHIVLSAPTLLVSRYGAQLPRSAWHSLNWTVPLEQFYCDGYSFWGDVFLSLTGAQGQPLAATKWQVIPVDEASFCREIKARCARLLSQDVKAA